MIQHPLSAITIAIPPSHACYTPHHQHQRCYYPFPRIWQLTGSVRGRIRTQRRRFIIDRQLSKYMICRPIHPHYSPQSTPLPPPVCSSPIYIPLKGLLPLLQWLGVVWWYYVNFCGQIVYFLHPYEGRFGTIQHPMAQTNANYTSHNNQMGQECGSYAGLTVWGRLFEVPSPIFNILVHQK